MKRRTQFLFTAAAPAALAAAALQAAPAYAQSTTAEQARSFNVPAGRLAQSVLALSEQAGVQMVFDSDAIGGVQGNAVNGSLTLSQALSQLLNGTGLRWRWLRAGVVTIEGVPASDGGERVLGAVRIEGAQGSSYFGGAGKAAGVNGVNGSRDITATEGTGSYTSGALTIGSKAPQALKDVPQSISVLTSARLEEQNITDFNSAMRQLPGVSFAQGQDAYNLSFYSRGYTITTVQVDGGAPVAGVGFYFPVLDMSVYDHVEILRGANGQFTGYGNPGGTVNLVRKKPLDHNQVILQAQAGSWQDYRLMADMTGPVALDGALRARLVLNYQNNHFYYDVAHSERALAYGIAEWDATPTTLVTIGGNYTRQNDLPFAIGLPRYQTGKDIELPRSTCLCFPWNKIKFQTTEAFGQIDQKIGDDWSFKLNVMQRWQKTKRRIGFNTDGINETNRLGSFLTGDISDFSSDQFSAEFAGSGAINIFGQRQEVSFGIDHSIGNGQLTSHQTPFDVFSGPIRGPGGITYCYDFTPNCPAGSVASSCRSMYSILKRC
jgi:outer-membrane receptor for ferric coprogen and ferric-rhodotorulic acid